MTRKRKSDRKAEKDEEELKAASQLIPYLPSHIVKHILSRVPVKDQLICRFVSEHRFARPQLLLRASTGPRKFSRTLQLFDLLATPYNTRCHYPKLKLSPRLNLPDWSFDFVASCNGLLCLWQAESALPFSNNIMYICNPILCEYVKLRKSDCFFSTYSKSILFGFSQKKNEFKLIRFYHQEVGNVDKVTWNGELNTLSKSQCSMWISLGVFPSVPKKQPLNSFVNEAFHWLACDGDFATSEMIHSFDFDTDQFRALPAPPHFSENHRAASDFISLGALRGCLYVTDPTPDHHFDIWVMKEYGVKESWTKVFTIPTNCIGAQPRANYQPLMIGKNNEIVMLCNDHVLVSYDPVLESQGFLGMPSHGSAAAGIDLASKFWCNIFLSSASTWYASLLRLSVSEF